jgi:hypothetical protein
MSAFSVGNYQTFWQTLQLPSSGVNIRWLGVFWQPSTGQAVGGVLDFMVFIVVGTEERAAIVIAQLR